MRFSNFSLIISGANSTTHKGYVIPSILTLVTVVYFKAWKKNMADMVLKMALMATMDGLRGIKVSLLRNKTTKPIIVPNKKRKNVNCMPCMSLPSSANLATTEEAEKLNSANRIKTIPFTITMYGVKPQPHHKK